MPPKLKRGWAPSNTRNKVYAPPPTLYGGTSFVLVDLNKPIPEPDARWLRDRLAEIEKACEFPQCDATAVVMIKVGKYLPYLCAQHAGLLKSGDSTSRRLVGQYIAQDMMDAVLSTSFGRPDGAETRRDKLEQLSVQRIYDGPVTVATRESLQLRPFGQL